MLESSIDEFDEELLDVDDLENSLNKD